MRLRTGRLLMSKLNQVAALKSINKTVVSKGSKIYGISNEYKDNDGNILAVGFTSNSAFLLDYEGSLADTDIMKDMFIYWIMEDELSLDDAVDFEEVKVILTASEDGAFKPANKALRERFSEDALGDIELKLKQVSELISGELELSEDDILNLMNG